jgi:ABC-type polysaccharide/polyol phosphate transport system ATPase subunit
MIRFDNVSKRYRISRERENPTTDRSLVSNVRRLWQSKEDFWAVRDVSFEVQQGEALGIIGHNGAGKSTILKLLYNITKPTAGEIRISGRLSALIEIASGFHPDLTGRENVYLNGSLLGMRRSEITRKLESIVEFAGIAQFVDTPVKRYSSGMYLRLGFAIAAHLEPDVLLLDEVLAVGDAAFQAKCIGRINELKQAGKTIVFVSHNLSAVESLCDRVLLLHHGQVIKSGIPTEITAEYERLLLTLPSSRRTTLSRNGDLPECEITGVTFLDAAREQTTMFSTGNPVWAEVEFIAHNAIEDAVLEVYFYSVFGNLHTHLSTENGSEQLNIGTGRGAVHFFCPELTLGEAAYTVEVGIKRRGSTSSEHIDYKHGAVINVGRGRPVHGVFHTPHSWSLNPPFR